MVNNPYQILGIPDLSSQEIAEEAFRKRFAEFDKIPALNDKQSRLLDELFEANSQLQDPLIKASIDEEINNANFNQQTTRLSEDISLQDTQDDEFEEKKLSKNKKIAVKKGKESSSIFSIFLIGLIVLFGATYAYNILFKQQAKPALKVEPKAPEPPKEITATPLIETNMDNIVDLVRYPDPSAFNDAQMIYAPDGTVFPSSAAVLGSLPINGDGLNTLIIQNPKDSAIFGRVVSLQAEGIKPKILRYFYIPPKETLFLFKISAGRQQIQIMTLTNPTAFVSPIYSLPLGISQEEKQVADWEYPYKVTDLF